MTAPVDKPASDAGRAAPGTEPPMTNLGGRRPGWEKDPRRGVWRVGGLGVWLAVWGQAGPGAEQGPVCQSMAKFGQLPEPFPDITPSELQAEHAKETTRHFARSAAVGAAPAPPPAPALPGVKATAFRAKIATQAATKRARLRAAPGVQQGPEPTRILSVSAGRGWGALSHRLLPRRR